MYIKFVTTGNNTTHILQISDISYNERENMLAIAGLTASGMSYFESEQQITEKEYENIEKELIKNRFCDITNITAMDLYYSQEDVKTL